MTNATDIRDTLPLILRPAAESVPTPDLSVGDVVLAHGYVMRVTADKTPSWQTGTVRAWSTVTIARTVETPDPFVCCWGLDYWTLQGNHLASEWRATDCHAARSGEGYWTCDLGGCQDCRAIARDAGDREQLADWG